MQQHLVAGLRWVAGLAGIAVLATACSSGAPPANSGATAAADLSVVLGKLVQCLHTHGERGVYLSHAPSSPDPRSTLIIIHGFAVEGADRGTPQFATAMQACQHLIPHGTPPSATELHQAFIKGVKATQCMRSHGYPTWPDPPTGPNAYYEQAVPPPGTDTSSPRFQAAAKTCGVALPGPGGAG
jgi:hypothetical protein